MSMTRLPRRVFLTDRRLKQRCCSKASLHKLAERGISVDEVTELFQTTPTIWIKNPNPRVEDSRWLIGPTRTGRFLTVVVDPDRLDHGRWHVMTAWKSTEAQIRLCRNAR